MKRDSMLRRKALKSVFIESQKSDSMQSLESQSYTVSLIKDRCKGCEVCTEFCPRDILEMSHEYNEKGYHFPRLISGKQFSDCSGCNFCEIVCPEFAIIVNKLEK